MLRKHGNALVVLVASLAIGPALAASGPTGRLDGADTKGGGGWAYDPSLGAAPATVEIHVDGVLATTVTADSPRPDLVAAGAAPEPEHGFSFQLGALSPGSHRVDAFIVTGGTKTALLGSGKTVTVTGAASAPVGFLDAANATVAAGWAYDASLGGAAVAVEITVDGQHFDTVVASSPRPDLVTAGVAAEPNHGFTSMLFGLAPGAHTIDAYALTASGRVALTGTGKVVTIAGAPRPATSTPIGFLDGADPTAAYGWAYDASRGAAPVTVHIYVDGTFLTAVDASAPRPDLVSAGVAAEPGHGFVAPLAGLAPGKHQVEAFAIAQSGTNPRLEGSGKLVAIPRAPIPGVPAKRFGAVDALSTGGELTGYAYDPLVADLTVQVFADAPMDQGGALVGSVIANGAKPSVVGPRTAWSWVAPTSLRDGQAHALYVYAVDENGANAVELTGSGAQVLQTIVSGLGDLTLQGREVTITTSSRFGGACTGITWNGLQFVNDDDHGRQCQTAWTFGYGERLNPTEAGSSADGAGPSRSIVLDAAVSGTTLTTRSFPAYWDLPGSKSPNFGGTGFVTALDGTEVSSDLFTKTVTVDAGGDPHLVRWVSEITLFADAPSLYAEIPTPYLTADFSEYYTWDPATGTLAPIGHTPAGPDGWFKPGDAFGDQPLPIILATASGSHALGIYTPEAGAEYGRFDFRATGHTSKSTIAVARHGVPGGAPVRFTSYIAVGTLDQVQKSLAFAASAKP